MSMRTAAPLTTAPMTTAPLTTAPMTANPVINNPRSAMTIQSTPRSIDNRR
jgi:hypothetical protein